MEKAVPVKNKNVNITDSFWSEKIKLIRNEVIPYQWSALNDEINGAEKSYCLRNFALAGELVEKRRNGIETPVFPTDKWVYTPNDSSESSFLGWVFQDSDFAKWIESVAYCLENEKDPELEAIADRAIDIVCKAQQDNGYLDTFYTINNPEKAFTNLRDHHELYCFGHLAEGAVAYYNATGKDKLLNAVKRFADLICSTFGEGKKEGYGGHEIAELAFVKLYRATGDKKYLDMARLLIERRGKKPYYFDIEQGKDSGEELKYHYNQAHLPVLEQNEAVGHAVRAVYLYTGMADVAMETGNTELFNACERLFDNITEKKMYITGGIGSTKDGEAFTFDYDLPNDLAYAESCASIGLVFFAQRMLQMSFDSKYADAMERCLYNGILSGIALDGKSFFYVNPLEVNPTASKRDSRKDHIKPVRQKWFSCACCPPNIARLISDYGEYCFTESKEAIFVNLYQACRAECEKAVLEISGDYAENGKVQIKINTDKSFKLALRIPYWSDGYTFSKEPLYIEKGYAYFEINSNDEILADFNARVKIIKCNPRVRSNTGRVAITRGPFVYCLEGLDNGSNLHLLWLDKNADFKYESGVITANGKREIVKSSNLYCEYTEPELEAVKLTFIPYCKWANRGENEMSVYINY